MTSSLQEPRTSADLFSLIDASMVELIAALAHEDALAPDDEGGQVPARAVQIADLIRAEAVRLIRLGTRTELTQGASALARALIKPFAAVLEERHPEAYRVAAAASVTLAGATAPSSSGGELAILWSWNGKARDAVAAVSHSPEQCLPRAELRTRLGDLEESHLSHLLADLEAAGLIVRIREGQTVMVHLGPIGKSEHVQDLLPRKGIPLFWSSGQEEGQDLRLSTWFDKAVPSHNPEPSYDRQRVEINAELFSWREDEKGQDSSADGGFVPVAYRAPRGNAAFKRSFALAAAFPHRELSE